MNSLLSTTTEEMVETKSKYIMFGIHPKIDGMEGICIQGVCCIHNFKRYKKMGIFDVIFTETDLNIERTIKLVSMMKDNHCYYAIRNLGKVKSIEEGYQILHDVSSTRPHYHVL